MDNTNTFEEFDVPINLEEPLFVISVVSKMVHIPVWTLRKLDELGIVCPVRIGKKTRCYSKMQMRKLNYIHYLMAKRRVNISGIKVILEMEGREQ